MVWVQNYGRPGTVFQHPHSPVIASAFVPRVIEEELKGFRDYARWKERCVLCDIVKQEQRDGRRLLGREGDGAAFAPFASCFPYEFCLRMNPGSYLPEHFLPVAIFLLLGSAMGVGLLVAGWFIRPRNPYREKLLTYESGITPFMDAHQKFSIRYYIVAMLFLVFDLEAVFLYPWAVAFDKIGLYGLIEMVIFIVILLVGYVYAWKKGALERE